MITQMMTVVHSERAPNVWCEVVSSILLVFDLDDDGGDVLHIHFEQANIVYLSSLSKFV